jgi:hypothetical protein
VKLRKASFTARGRRHAIILLAAIACLVVGRAYAVRHQWSRPAPLRFTSLVPAFTNPACRLYPYAEPQLSVGGESISTKPQGAYCTNLDLDTTRALPNRPLGLALGWIQDPSTRSIFVSALSMNHELVADALCRASKERGVRVTVVIDAQQQEDAAARLRECWCCQQCRH